MNKYVDFSWFISAKKRSKGAFKTNIIKIDKKLYPTKVALLLYKLFTMLKTNYILKRGKKPNKQGVSQVLQRLKLPGSVIASPSGQSVSL